MRGSPDAWARRAVDAYHRHRADEIVAEGNQGGDLVRLTLQTVDEDVPVTIVHATHGKRTRAEPVAALYEQGRVHHVGTFSALEDQLCLWDATSGDISPDRLDALVWAVTQLGVDNAPVRLVNTESPVDASGPPSGWLREILMRGRAPKAT
jgi:phage terminase large subunit-like protein